MVVDGQRRLAVRGLMVLSVGIAALALPAAAGAQAPPCWKTLLNDWYDGRIDGTYEVRCYREAIAHVPDVDGDVRRDVSRTFAARLASVRRLGSVGPTTLLPAALAPARANGHSGAILRAALALVLVSLLVAWVVLRRRTSARPRL